MPIRSVSAPRKEKKSLRLSRASQKLRTPPVELPVIYLKKNLSDCLPLALHDVCQIRPADPIDFLARWLYKYVDCELYYHEKVIFAKEIRVMVLELEQAKSKRQARIRTIKQEIRALKLVIRRQKLLEDQLWKEALKRAMERRSAAEEVPAVEAENVEEEGTAVVESENEASTLRSGTSSSRSYGSQKFQPSDSSTAVFVAAEAGQKPTTDKKQKPQRATQRHVSISYHGKKKSHHSDDDQATDAGPKRDKRKRSHAVTSSSVREAVEKAQKKELRSGEETPERVPSVQSEILTEEEFAEGDSDEEREAAIMRKARAKQREEEMKEKRMKAKAIEELRKRLQELDKETKDMAEAKKLADQERQRLKMEMEEEVARRERMEKREAARRKAKLRSYEVEEEEKRREESKPVEAGKLGSASTTSTPQSLGEESEEERSETRFSDSEEGSDEGSLFDSDDDLGHEEFVEGESMSGEGSVWGLDDDFRKKEEHVGEEALTGMEEQSAKEERMWQAERARKERKQSDRIRRDWEAREEKRESERMAEDLEAKKERRKTIRVTQDLEARESRRKSVRIGQEMEATEEIREIGRMSPDLEAEKERRRRRRRSDRISPDLEAEKERRRSDRISPDLEAEKERRRRDRMSSDSAAVEPVLDLDETAGSSERQDDERSKAQRERSSRKRRMTQEQADRERMRIQDEEERGARVEAVGRVSESLARERGQAKGEDDTSAPPTLRRDDAGSAGGRKLRRAGPGKAKVPPAPRQTETSSYEESPDTEQDRLEMPREKAIELIRASLRGQPEEDLRSLFSSALEVGQQEGGAWASSSSDYQDSSGHLKFPKTGRPRVSAQRVQSARKCRWVLLEPGVLVCKHPLLGDITSHRPAVGFEADSPSYWDRQGHDWSVLYDPEVYTVENPRGDDSTYAELMAAPLDIDIRIIESSCSQIDEN